MTNFYVTIRLFLINTNFRYDFKRFQFLSEQGHILSMF